MTFASTSRWRRLRDRQRRPFDSRAMTPRTGDTAFRVRHRYLAVPRLQTAAGDASDYEARIDRVLACLRNLAGEPVIAAIRRRLHRAGKGIAACLRIRIGKLADRMASGSRARGNCLSMFQHIQGGVH